ncbi:MAG: SDR family oxidoreductase [Bacteroidota bacterium]
MTTSKQTQQLIIFGATGTLGRHLVQQALEQGHQVSAFSRNPQKLAITHPRLRLIQGDVLDPAAVKNALEGHDTVICALGAGRKGQVRATGTLHILQGMEALGIERFICQTTLGAGDSVDSLNFFWKRIMFGWFLKQAYEDHQLQEQYIRESKVAWTIVRPAAFTDGEKTGRYQSGHFTSPKNLKLKISRADVADFMLRLLGKPASVRDTIGLSY